MYPRLITLEIFDAIKDLLVVESFTNDYAFLAVANLPGIQCISMPSLACTLYYQFHLQNNNLEPLFHSHQVALDV